MTWAKAETPDSWSPARRQGGWRARVRVRRIRVVLIGSDRDRSRRGRDGMPDGASGPQRLGVPLILPWLCPDLVEDDLGADPMVGVHLEEERVSEPAVDDVDLADPRLEAGQGRLA